MTITIPQKQSGNGSIHDMASDSYAIDINMGSSYEFAVVPAAYYGMDASRHKTAEAALRKLASLGDYSVTIIGRDGYEYHANGPELRKGEYIETLEIGE